MRRLSRRELVVAALTGLGSAGVLSLLGRGSPGQSDDLEDPDGSEQSRHWVMVHPCNTSPQAPSARDVWGGMDSDADGLLLFGGASAHAPPQSRGDMSTLRTQGDLWRFHRKSRRWELLERSSRVSRPERPVDRPGGRVLPVWRRVGNSFYLFGGQSVNTRHWRNSRLCEDLWCYLPGQKTWTYLGPSRAGIDHARHPAAAGAACATLDDNLFIVSGYAGIDPDIYSTKLSLYCTSDHEWHNLRPIGVQGKSPNPSLCAAFVEWGARLYHFGGRNSNDQAYYNALYQYDPFTDRWLELQGNDPSDSRRPSPRYGFGYGVIDGYFYVFGGFGAGGYGPQLNDLWRLNLRDGSWEQLQENDGSKDYSSRASRPAVRRVPASAIVNNGLWIFGGVDFTSGLDHDGPTVALNDLWRYTPGPA